MSNLNHTNELWNESEYLLSQIKRTYNVHHTHNDEEALKHIKNSLMEYADYAFEHNKKAKVKVHQHG
jgi:hypothetical protein